MKNGSTRMLAVGMCSVAVLSASSLLSGCVGYATYPPVQGAYGAPNNPNAPPVDELMALSLKWVTDRYPIRTGSPAVAGEPRFAINLPRGVRKSIYERTAASMGDKAQPLTPENATALPIYHVAEIRVRGRVAKVDVLRPAQELGSRPDGQPVYQCITLHIEGGFQQWRVIRFQAWEPGVVQVPEYYYIPPVEWPDRERAEELRSVPGEKRMPSEPVMQPADEPVEIPAEESQSGAVEAVVPELAEPSAE